ncbi:MAG: hypothetical protein K8R69_04720, partial [Deltaproteobacteria bacterium]|nr:hypothetical protein [Deltaproteobacteria bacterium]
MIFSLAAEDRRLILLKSSIFAEGRQFIDAWIGIARKEGWLKMKRMHNTSILLLASLVGMGASPLHGEDKALSIRPPTVDIYQVPFDELDVNHDGILSKSEWRGDIQEFYQLDDNGDGVLTRVEFSDRSDE